MSGEKYQRPKGFPDWVNSIGDEVLVGDALFFDIPPLGLNSKNTCERFVNNKRNLSAPLAGKD